MSDNSSEFEKIANSNPMVAKVLRDSELLSIMCCPEVWQTQEHRYDHSFESQSNETRVLWANNVKKATEEERALYELPENCPTLHHGQQNATNFAESGNAAGKDQVYMLMAYYEDPKVKNHDTRILNLYEIEERKDLDQPTKQAIYAIASRGFALGASNKVAISGDGVVNAESILRMQEIPAIMNNELVHEVTVLLDTGQKDKDGKTILEKREFKDGEPEENKMAAYNALKDRWTENAIGQYKAALKEPNTEQNAEIIASKRTQLAKEYAMEQTMVSEYERCKKEGKEYHPFSKGGLYPEQDSPAFSEEDYKKAKVRVEGMKNASSGDKILEEEMKQRKGYDQYQMTKTDEIIYTFDKLANGLKTEGERKNLGDNLQPYLVQKLQATSVQQSLEQKPGQTTGPAPAPPPPTKAPARGVTS